MQTISKDKLQQLIAEARAKAALVQQQQAQAQLPTATPAPLPTATPTATPTAQIAPKAWEWNAEQMQAMEMFRTYNSFAIVGSAGTGKSTLCKAAIAEKIQCHKMPLLRTGTQYLSRGAPGIVAVSFTRSAVANINRIIGGIIPVLTIHKILEFKPVFYEIMDEATGDMRSTMRMEPTYTAANPLPAELRTIIIEESGIVNIRLFQQFLDALPYPELVQFIFLGDLFQLDPPYDPSILSYLHGFRNVELTQVYRQALNSPILQFVCDIKAKQTWGSQHFPQLNKQTPDGSLEVKPWKKALSSFAAVEAAAKFLEKEWDAGRWNPTANCCIILPYGAALQSKNREDCFGSYNLNKLIANFVGKRYERVVHEVIAGYAKHYLAVGDEVSFQKERGIITSINRNAAYRGTISPQAASKNLDRFGHYESGFATAEEELAAMELSQEELEHEADRLLSMEAGSDDSSALRNASHNVEILLDNGTTITLNTSGEFNPQVFDFAYAMTCYKAQGMEWQTVYVFTHKSHAPALCNEFFYTACSRAKQQLVLICEPDHLMNPIKRQSVPGNNWKEKMEYFQQPKKLEALRAFPLLNDWLALEKSKAKQQAQQQLLLEPSLHNIPKELGKTLFKDGEYQFIEIRD